jgi:CRP-like cAMP-binding protein
VRLPARRRRATLAQPRHELDWVELPAGGVLTRQGEPGDAMYLLASGGLRVSHTGADG